MQISFLMTIQSGINLIQSLFKAVSLTFCHVLKEQKGVLLPY